MSLSPTSLKTARPLPAHALFPTFTAVLAGIWADGTLTLRKRQDVASALRTAAKACRCSMDEVQADPAELRSRFRNFCPAQEGLSERRWRNVLSLLRFALKHAGVSRVPGRHATPMSPEWTALLGDAKATIRERRGLSRVGRYCSLRGIEPMAVNDAVLEQFGCDLAVSELGGSTETACRRVAVIWNRMMSRRSCGAQGTLLTVLVDPRKFSLPWSAFPASLVDEIGACFTSMSEIDDFDPRNLTSMQSSSIQTLRWQLRAYLSALVHQGHPAHTLDDLGRVMVIDTVKLGLRFFLKRAKQRSTGRRTDQAHRIATCLLLVARYRKLTDPKCLEELRALCRNIHPGQSGMTDKNRARLRQFDDPANVLTLLRLPKKLAAQAGRNRVPSRSDAVTMQTALAIEILLVNPIRRGNLVRLDMHRHLVRSRRGIVQLVIPAEEVKNRIPIDAVLPAETVRLLDRYVDRYRPLLADLPSPWLFPGLGGRSKCLEGMTMQISDTVRKHTGLQMNPHLFRHFAAKLYLDRNPGAYGVPQRVLGHKSVNTTTTFYCGTETASALRHYDDLVLTLRDSSASTGLKTGKQVERRQGNRSTVMPKREVSR